MPQYAAVFDLTDLDGNNGFKISGEPHGATGRAVDAGDVNGDGFDDLIISGVGNRTGTGGAYIVYGHASGFDPEMKLHQLDGINGVKLTREVSYSGSTSFGSSISSAGDVNGDGIGDFIVGADNLLAFGGAYVVFGNTSGFGAVFDMSALDGANGFEIDGEGQGGFSNNAGFSVSNAGDVNGDGFDDVLVGASHDGPDRSYYGAAYVIFGQPSGFLPTFQLSSLDGTNGFKIAGENNHDDLGKSLSSAGDVNGDGYADLLIGAPYADPNGSASGATYVVFGKASGFDATLNVSGLDGTNGFEIDGKLEGHNSGKSVSDAGDINADGFDDLIIGAPNADPHRSDFAGSSYIVFGKASGFDPTLELANLDGINGFRLDGGETRDQSGTCVSAAGDVNGDGYDDLIIGAPGVRSGWLHGAAYVVFGKASGFEPAVSLSSLDGNNGFEIEGKGMIPYGEGFGVWVSAAGDIDGDGFADLVASAPRANRSEPGVTQYDGAHYVIFGSMPGEAVTRTGTAIDNTIQGGDFDDTLSGLGGNDTLYGHGGNDMVDGGDGNDTLDGGDGNDTLLAGKGMDTLAGGAGDDSLYGGDRKDTLNGDDGNDTLVGGAAADLLNGGEGADTFSFAGASDSTGSTFDGIKNADFTSDVFDLTVAIGGIDAEIDAGRLRKGNFDSDLAAVVDDAHLAAGHAVLFTPTAGNESGRTFLIVDLNGVAGYQAGEDLVVQLITPQNLASLGVEDFV